MAQKGYYEFKIHPKLGPALPYALYRREDKEHVCPIYISSEAFHSLIDHGCGFCYGKAPEGTTWRELKIFKYIIVGNGEVTDQNLICELDEWQRAYNEEQEAWERGEEPANVDKE